MSDRANHQAVEQEPGTVRVRDISDLEDQTSSWRTTSGWSSATGPDCRRRSSVRSTPGAYPVILALTAYGKDLGPDTYPAPARYAELPDFDNGIVEVSPWTTWEGPTRRPGSPRAMSSMYLDVRGYHAVRG
jgi:hypothetical protein